MIYVATMDAERCEWVAAGATEQEALDALAAGFNASPYYGADATLPALDGPSLVEQYGARVVRLSAGECSRDGETVSTDGQGRPSDDPTDLPHAARPDYSDVPEDADPDEIAAMVEAIDADERGTR